MNDEQRVKFEAFLIEHDSEIGHGRYHKYHPMYPDQYFDYNAHIAWLAWQAAQQVKSLEWVEVSDALKVVKTVFGEYGVFISGSVTSAKFAGDDYYSRLFSIEAEAIAAANADYQRRVLSCLVWGWV